MMLPAMRLPGVPVLTMDTPVCLLPEMTLPAPAAVPPMVSPDVEPNRNHAVALVGDGGGTGGVGADVVALDDGVRRAAPDVDGVVAVAGDDVAGRGRGAADGDGRRADHDADARWPRPPSCPLASVPM